MRANHQRRILHHIQNITITIQTRTKQHSTPSIVHHLSPPGACHVFCAVSALLYGLHAHTAAAWHVSLDMSCGGRAVSAN